MSKRADYTAEEWEAIRRAPAESVVAIEQASPSGFWGRHKEKKEARRTFKDVIAQHGSLELIAEIVAARDAEGALIDEIDAGGDSLVGQAIETASKARAALVAHATLEEREAYCLSVLRLSENVAGAAGEGDQVNVSGPEVMFLRRLAGALGQPDYEPPADDDWTGIATARPRY